MKKVYLVMQRHVVKIRKNSFVWSDWYLVGPKSCFLSLEHANNEVMRLRERCTTGMLDYKYQFVFVQDYENA